MIQIFYEGKDGDTEKIVIIADWLILFMTTSISKFFAHLFWKKFIADHVTCKNIFVIEASQKKKKLIRFTRIFFRFSFFSLSSLHLARWIDPMEEDLVSRKRDRIQSIRDSIFFHERDMRERTDIERDKETAVRFFNVGWNLSPLWLRVPILV